MDKRNRRTRSKRDNVKHAAFELFAAHGVDKVSMDEIAAKANVSKVTIYKYFGSKDELFSEVVNLFIDETLAATEAVFNSDIDFMEKLKYALLTPVNSTQLVSWNYLLEVWDKDGQLTHDVYESLQNKVKALMFKFFEEGKKAGYIDESLPFEILYLYSEIFRTGIQAKSGDMQAIFVDREALDKLVNLYFFGLIRRP